MKKVVVFQSSDGEKFEDKANELYEQGYVLNSSSCGYIGDLDYGGDCFMGIFELKDVKLHFGNCKWLDTADLKEIGKYLDENPEMRYVELEG